MGAIIALVIQYGPALMQLGEQGYEFVTKVRTLAQQTDEWTDEADAMYQAGRQALIDNPPDWLKTDDQLSQS